MQFSEEIQLFNQLFSLQGARSNAIYNFRIFLSKVTHRQTPTLNCAGVHKGKVLDRASAFLCDTRCRWCYNSDTSVGRNLFRRLTRFPALSSSVHECSFDTHPGKYETKGKQWYDMLTNALFIKWEKFIFPHRAEFIGMVEFHDTFICSVKYEFKEVENNF
jgi:hypothetical protein